MKNLAGTRTEQNLLKAFAGESQARNRYTFFAKKAKEEGYEQIAALFLETAENEKYHAEKFFNFLEGRPLEITATYPAGKVGTTAENLKAAAMGEKEEHAEIYPAFAEIAKEEGFSQIAAAFNLVAKVEVEHEERYLKLLKNLEEGKVFKKEDVARWKCRACGYIHEAKEAPIKCPLCGVEKAYFEIKETNY
ncbi:rubrerythrin [Paramaledivibacter caminithermalis]|jgi:rubrerythrin|uniref:Rubrerythrin n=1 Tax=Paramaledivibacter caminithermalis (strain DSM 15212 / CIP 107654 / DViRD3) TaxID=1121301 RepID=A0A1M6RZN2_PARC5|nr:rubrerythrin family protein [Paramaledivibacter caminithermalis]SHK37921.1 Rubrerythrin [Paramaledivibacter caminithermalis DSM 15212]